MQAIQIGRVKKIKSLKKYYQFSVMTKFSRFFRKESLSNKAIPPSKCEEKKVILSSDFSTSVQATVRSYNKFTDLLVTSITTEGLLTLCK